MSIVKQLVRLGKVRKDLRHHIRPVLAELKTAGALYNYDQLVESLSMVARNEGRFYSNRDAKGAVDAAAKQIQSTFLKDVRDAKRDAVRDVDRVWSQWDGE